MAPHAQKKPAAFDAGAISKIFVHALVWLLLLCIACVAV
jgi:hypothetical protein